MNTLEMPFVHQRRTFAIWIYPTSFQFSGHDLHSRAILDLADIFCCTFCRCRHDISALLEVKKM
jgi:hypothetical protein